jgi:hypothetical protein
MLLAVASGNAAAEWVEVGKTDTATTYADPATIRKASNIVKMWAMVDLKAAHTNASKTFMSIMIQNEFDCKEERVRELYEHQYSGNMGGGEAIYSGADPGKWVPIAPGSVGEALWKVGCGKR